MREIKFRAWDRQVKSMSASDWDMNKWEHYDPGRYITMQFTGLTDKNGKEIYEGDVCKWVGEGNVVFDDNIFGVQWDERRGGWFPLLPIDYQNTEVIGNIYENPDLIAP